MGRAVLALLLLAFLVAPQPRPAPVSTPIHSYADAVRHTAWVDTGTARVAADVIRPRTARPVPVIMVASPYNTTLGRGNEEQTKTYDEHGAPVSFPLWLDNYFVPRGYAVVQVDLPGTGRSTGCLDVGGPGDVGAARAVIDWLNGRATAYTSVTGAERATASWTTGDVGMIGKSWDGTIAVGVAGTRVEGLRTVVPIAAISSWYDYYRAGGTPLDSGTPAALAAEVDNRSDCPYPGLAAPPLSPDDPLWRARDYRPSAGAVRASVFAVHGLADANVRTIHFGQWWSGLTAPRRVWLTQAGHVDPFDFRRAEWVAALHQWFDHHLLGLDNGAPLGASVERAPGVWVDYPAWPAQTSQTTLHPTADGSLGTAPGEGSLEFADDQRTAQEWLDDTSSSRLLFRTGPLAADTRISGTPTVGLSARGDRVSVLLVDLGRATVRDPGEDGVRTLGTRSCWGDSAPGDSACYLDTDAPTVTVEHRVLAAGWTAGGRVEVPLGAVDAVVPAGHRIGLVIGGTDREALPEGLPGRVRVDLGGTVLRLPVVGTLGAGS
ncbi:Xaa-Pro dipeptidyl-peptidase [Actinokineospora soli]